jgi:hypothetical protein
MYTLCYSEGWSDVGDGFWDIIWNNSSNYYVGFDNWTTTTWNQMAQNYYETSTYNVAVLMSYIGASIGMHYKSDGSGADTDDLVGLFSNLGINSSYTGYNSNNVISSLNNNMPIILRADRTKHDIMFFGIYLGNWYENGHAWVANGD